MYSPKTLSSLMIPRTLLLESQKTVLLTERGEPSGHPVWRQRNLGVERALEPLVPHVCTKVLLASFFITAIGFPFWGCKGIQWHRSARL
jgi:hypothetical protein